MGNTCAFCQKPKVVLECGLCQSSLCKACTQFVEEDYFSFMPYVPEEISHQTYCSGCFDTQIVPAQNEYNQNMERAKDIMVFDKKQGKETRNIKRLEDPVTVTDCADENETILRLAFIAAIKNYNAVVDMEVVSKKIQHGSYKKMVWSGTAIPTQVDEKKLIKDRASWHNPN